MLVGEHDILNGTMDFATRHAVAHILDHPQYNPASVDYDYSIITLESAISLGPESYAR